MSRITVPALLAVFLLGGAPARSEEIGQFFGGDDLRLAAGEVHTGDLYAMAGSISIAGRQEGDLIAFSGAVVIQGEVEGDVAVGAESLDIGGRVSDSVRFFGANAVVDGTIDGDLIAFAGNVTLREKGHVTGNVILCGGRMRIEGRVDGGVSAVGGEIFIGGTVGKDANLEADAIKLGEQARILGNLSYKSRKELTLPSDDTVAGEIRYEEKVEKPKERSYFSSFSVAVWLWFTFSAILVGLVSLALFRKVAPALSAPIAGEPLVGVLVGFGTFLVVPAASLLAMLLVISLPLGALTLMAFLVAVYLAKLPVAVWLGRRLLGLAGRSDPSPYPALIVGVVVLYLLFEIPFMLGTFVWLLATWLGLGSFILATRHRLRERQA